MFPSDFEILILPPSNFSVYHCQCNRKSLQQHFSVTLKTRWDSGFSRTWNALAVSIMYPLHNPSSIELLGVLVIACLSAVSLLSTDPDSTHDLRSNPTLIFHEFFLLLVISAVRIFIVQILSYLMILVLLTFYRFSQSLWRILAIIKLHPHFSYSPTVKSTKLNSS